MNLLVLVARTLPNSRPGGRDLVLWRVLRTIKTLGYCRVSGVSWVLIEVT